MSEENPGQRTILHRVLVNLHLIRKLGPACLNTDGLPNAKKARLSELAVSDDNTLHIKTIIQADNLLDQAHGAKRIPGGTIQQATLQVEFQGSTTPHAVTLKHPDTVTFQFPQDAPAILRWLDPMGLTASKQAITALLLALSSPSLSALRAIQLVSTGPAGVEGWVVASVVVAWRRRFGQNRQVRRGRAAFTLELHRARSYCRPMKRISFFLAAVTLLTVGPVRAEDAATEERLNKLAGQIEDLKAGQEALRRQVESLVRELDAVRDQASKPTGNYAAVEDLNRLRDAIKEVDRKRIEDADKTRTELLRLGNLLAAGPGPAKRTGSSSSRASERANSERGSSERGSSERGTRELASNDVVKESSSKEGSKDGGKGQEEGFGYYQVQKGDTLSLIAQAYREKNIKLTPEQIVKANPGLVPEKLRVGQKLWIPAPQ